MKARARSLLLLTFTLLIGMALGALIHANFFEGRMKRMHSLRTEDGFIASYLETIQPNGPEQEAALRPIIESAAKEVGTLFQANRESIHKRMEAMRQSLYPLLDDEQKLRVEERAKRSNRGGDKKK